MINKQSLKNVYMVVLALFLFVLGVFGGRQMLPAFAEERVYTNVLADLQKDESFSVINYPEISDQKDELFGVIQVIQVAESESGELYLYTYQPSNKAKQLLATEINMSLSESVDGTSLFPLTLLNTNGVFCKYLVCGVVISSDTVRYYNISSVFRDWDKDIDGESSNDNIKNEKAFGVGKVFKAETVDGKITYFCKDVDVIEILNPYVGYLVYRDAYGWADMFFESYPYTNVHFIAFDTDLSVDKLEEADVSYFTQPYTWKSLKNEYTYGQKSDKQYLTITGESEGGANISNGWFHDYYTWKRIQSTTEFCDTVTLDSAALAEVKKTKWVLLFLETPFRVSEKTTLAGHETTEEGTRVTEVTILRLKFVTAGKTYNLGTVSDKVTGSINPVGGVKEKSWLDLLCEWLESVTGVPARVWKIIICALPFLILLPILAAVFPVFGNVLSIVVQAIGKAFVWLCKGVFWLICLPFKGIAALVRKIKERKESK